MAAVTDGDVAYLQSLYPYLDIKALTGQQEQLILNYFRGMSLTAAAEATGYRSLDAARRVLESDTGRTVVEHLKAREFNEVRVTRDTLTAMFMESYHLAATAGEKIAATRELGKLHGIYPESKKAGVEINYTNNQVNIEDMTMKQLQRLSDAELAKLGGGDLRHLLPGSEEGAGELIEATAEVADGSDD